MASRIRTIDAAVCFDCLEEKHFDESTYEDSFLVADLLWANHDVIFKQSGNVYLPASEPIPVTPAEPINPTAMLIGWLIGERIVGMRGKATPETN